MINTRKNLTSTRHCFQWLQSKAFVNPLQCMLDLMLWLSVCAVLGVVNEIAHLILLARFNRLEY